MTEERREFLNRRIKAAADQQPEILTLRNVLLALGGEELVPAPTLDSDVPILIEHGSAMRRTVKSTPIEEGRCHENVAELWREKKEGMIAVGVGYALSDDGLWRQHSWGVGENHEIIETTEARTQYFGRLLQGKEADDFAEANIGDPEDRRWRRLPEVYFRLTKDEDGYPPKEWEGLKAEPTSESDTYRIKSVPFFVRDVAYEDEVRTCTSEEGFTPVFDSVVRRSGFSVIRMIISETEDRAVLTEYFTNRECWVEFNGRLVAVAIPKAAYDDVSEYVCAGKDSGRWDAEDGHVAEED